MSTNSLRARKPNCHETSTVLWNTYCRVSLRGRHAQIRFSRGACDKNQKMTVRHFGFMKKVYGLLCTVRTVTVTLPKWRTVLPHTTRDAKRKKASRCKEDSVHQVQASQNSVLAPMQRATCTSVGVAVVNTHAIPPGQHLQVATFEMPESPSEQPVQTKQEPMHTGKSMKVATGTNVDFTVVNILPGHQLLRQTAAYVAPESPAEQPVQTRKEPMQACLQLLRKA